MSKLLYKYLFLGWFGGSFYVTLEVFWRNKSHWTMFLLAAFVFVVLGLLNEVWNWNLLTQTIVGTIIATASEFVTGCVFNLWLGWHIWDYSGLPGNILGQICPQFTALWSIIVIFAIVVDDVIRWKFFDEEKPHYKLF